jgi:hypothetical protein
MKNSEKSKSAIGGNCITSERLLGLSYDLQQSCRTRQTRHFEKDYDKIGP